MREGLLNLSNGILHTINNINKILNSLLQSVNSLFNLCKVSFNSINSFNKSIVFAFYFGKAHIESFKLLQELSKLRVNSANFSFGIVFKVQDRKLIQQGSISQLPIILNKLCKLSVIIIFVMSFASDIPKRFSFYLIRQSRRNECVFSFIKKHCIIASRKHYSNIAPITFENICASLRRKSPIGKTLFYLICVRTCTYEKDFFGNGVLTHSNNGSNCRCNFVFNFAVNYNSANAAHRVFNTVIQELRLIYSISVYTHSAVARKGYAVTLAAFNRGKRSTFVETVAHPTSFTNFARSDNLSAFNHRSVINRLFKVTVGGVIISEFKLHSDRFTKSVYNFFASYTVGITFVCIIALLGADFTIAIVSSVSFCRVFKVSKSLIRICHYIIICCNASVYAVSQAVHCFIQVHTLTNRGCRGNTRHRLRHRRGTRLRLKRRRVRSATRRRWRRAARFRRARFVTKSWHIRNVVIIAIFEMNHYLIHPHK